MDNILYSFSVFMIPVLFVLSGRYQPNKNRTDYAYGFSIISVAAMLACECIPDSYYWASYLFAAVLYCGFIDWLCSSENDEQWCWRLIIASSTGIVINICGCAIWLLYLDPLPYNVAITVLNIYMLWAIMLDGDIHRRFDGLGVARRARSIDFYPRVLQHIKQGDAQ